MAEEKCVWTYQDAAEYLYWETSCGSAFYFEDGTPSENGQRFCGYCGKPLVEIIPQPELEEE